MTSDMRREVLLAFLSDAGRIFGQAKECVKEMTRNAARGALDPELVRRFYHCVHSLKGTASMIEGGGPIVEALQALEAKLACYPLSVTAKKLDWLPLAQKAMQQTEAALQQIRSLTLSNSQSQQRVKLQSITEFEPHATWQQTQTRGFLARSRLFGDIPDETLIWFPLQNLISVMTPTELAGRTVLCIHGAWVPVFGNQTQAVGELSIAFSTDHGNLVVVTQEILEITSWSEAVRKGAIAAPDLLKEFSESTSFLSQTFLSGKKAAA